MNKYEIRTQNKKNAIIHAALELFNKNGFINTSIKEIAAIAKVSQVSIYNYFGSKDMLVFECAKIIMNDTFHRLKGLLVTELSFREKLFTALALCSEQVNQSLSKYLTQTALSDESLMMLLADHINQIKSEIYKDYIELGKKEGDIDSSIPTSSILKFMDCLNKTQIDALHFEEEQHALHQLFLFGIIGKS